MLQLLIPSATSTGTASPNAKGIPEEGDVQGGEEAGGAGRRMVRRVQGGECREKSAGRRVQGEECREESGEEIW